MPPFEWPQVSRVSISSPPSENFRPASKGSAQSSGLCRETNAGAPAFVSLHEPLDCAEPFDAGRKFSDGGLEIETRLTWGHSKGGITYVISGLSRPVAIV